jgi:hypothetical protein
MWCRDNRTDRVAIAYLEHMSDLEQRPLDSGPLVGELGRP